MGYAMRQPIWYYGWTRFGTSISCSHSAPSGAAWTGCERWGLTKSGIEGRRAGGVADDRGILTCLIGITFASYVGQTGMDCDEHARC